MNNIDHPGPPIILKVNVPDKGVFEKRFTFKHEEKVWAAKEQVIHEIAGKESKDIQNYGFFVPPNQGKAGKFMDEGRPLSEYSLPGEDQCLEFILKRRIYRSISFDENKLTKVHTKANLKKLMELVEQNNAGQVNQFLEKGLDPNFLDSKTGETPLTTAAVMDNAMEVIMFLVNGGAYMDFRNRNGLTAVHRAAAAGRAHNIKAFLDLGASPNYRDLKGLTPLYHACLSCSNPHVVELLLSDQSDSGVVDSQEWQEIHQACRYGYIHHLEQLIYYGANLNAQNGTGNTPLHICSLYNQEDCARLLLYRGARRDIVNFANQTAEMVAVVATNTKLSEVIKNYNDKDVVPYIDKPAYSTRRRAQSKTRPMANSVFLRDSTDTFLFCSENLSTTSSTPSLHSETSEPMSLDLSPREPVPSIQVTADKTQTRKYKRNRTMSGSGSDSSYASDSGDETGGSAVTSPVDSLNANELSMRWRTYSLSSLNKEERGTIPRVKEVKGAANMMSMNKKPSGKSNSRKMYVAIKNFTPTQGGELSLAEGDIIEVLTKGEKGFWQGTVTGKTGWFPAECVEELKKRKHRSKNALHKPPSLASSLNKSNTSLEQAPASPVTPTPEERQVILHKVKAGFGFQMRGANAPTVNKLEFQPSSKIPALQYIGEIEPGGEAERGGLKKGDYILEVNGNDVRTASHRHVVSLIRKTGHNLILKVISIDKKVNGTNEKPPGITRSNSLPTGMMPLANGTSSHDGPSKEKKPPPIPSRAPTTSLSMRPKAERHSVADVNFEEPRTMFQEDRVISVPRERISPTDTQWQSPLTGHVPKRPESSYGAIIGSTHSPTEVSTKRNYRPVEYLDNTGFMTLPSKPTSPTARPMVSMDDTAVNRRRDGATGGRDRPKSWMPKVLPTEVPAPGPPAHVVTKRHSSDELVKRSNESAKTPSREAEGRKEKKRRFSFKKKKEKDYVATVTEVPTDEAEDDVPDETGIESLHFEEEETRPSSIPGLHKRLSTFKPVTGAQHRHTFENEVVSPELSQALEKRKSRVGSVDADDFPPPMSPPHGYAPPAHYAHTVAHAQSADHPHVPPPPAAHAPNAPKSLEESIRDEMMRRRANSAPASDIPSKPRRTFEYKRSADDTRILEGEGPVMNSLDSELAKAIARRAEKITSEPEKPPPIYENVKDLTGSQETQAPSPVQEPAALTIEEKMKKLRLNDEIVLPTKFKPPAQPPPVKARPGKVPPPKTLPKPKRKSSSEEPTTPRGGMTLPLTANVDNLPPPILSPEMVATQFLDDVIDEEVKNSNWDTTSWIDKDFSTPKSSPRTSISAPVQQPPASPLATPSPPGGHTAESEVSSPDGATGAGKTKYVYKITFVTENPSDGAKPVEHPPVITKIVSNETPTRTRRPTPDASDLPPPPPPPPVEFHDESITSIPSPVFTPPNSPPAKVSGTPHEPAPPVYHPVFEESPPPVQVQPTPSIPQGTSKEEMPPPQVQGKPPPPVQDQPLPPVEDHPPPPIYQPSQPYMAQQPPPPVLVDHPPPPISQPPQPPTSQPPPSVQERPPPPTSEPPQPPKEQQPPPPVQEQLPTTVHEQPPPPVHEQPPPPVHEQPPPPIQEQPLPPVHEQPPPPVQEQPHLPLQEQPPPPAQEQQPPPPVHEQPPPPVQEQPHLPLQEQPPPPDHEQQPPAPVQEKPPPPTSQPPTEQPPPPPVEQELPPPPMSEPPEPPTSQQLPPQVSQPPQPPTQSHTAPIEEPSADQFNSPLPPPVVSPPTKTPDIGVHEISPPPEYEEAKKEVEPSIIVPPPVFTDSGPKDEKPASEKPQESRPPLDQSESVVDGPKNVVPEGTTESNGKSGADVPAPPRDTVDQNKNFVVAPAIYGGDTEEQAPAKLAVSEVPVDSSTFREIPYLKWSCVHVCQWLDSIAMAEHQDLFRENDIRGPNLVGLTKEDLRELGVKKLGHRMTIADEVHKLTTTNSENVKL